MITLNHILGGDGETGINTYSFALNPLDPLDPLASGTINFSSLDNFILKLSLDEGFVNHYKQIEVTVYAINENIFRIFASEGELA